MKILALAQQKGGVGKSTLARIVGEYAALKGFRTLFIDLDHQSNLSMRYMSMESVQEPSNPDLSGYRPPVHPDADESADWAESRSSVADIYAQRSVHPYPTHRDNIEIVPGHHTVTETAIAGQDASDPAIDRIKSYLASPDVRDRYDLVVIDTPPSSGVIVQGALRAADALILPTQTTLMAIEGLRLMLQMWRRESRQREHGEALKLIGILPNQLQLNTSLHSALLQNLEVDPVIGQCLTPVSLTNRVGFSESDYPSGRSNSVFDRSARDKARHEAMQVGRYVLDALGLVAAQPASDDVQMGAVQ